MKWVLDTNAFSAVMKRDAGILALLSEYPPGDIATAPPVVAEIHFGLSRIDQTSKKYLLLNSEKTRFLSVITVLDWIPQASVLFGKIKADLERRGKIIDDFDIAIAAIAMSHQCGVLTANRKHFERIKKLECMTW